MDKVQIIFYENYGNKKIHTSRNVIPTTIRTGARENALGKKEMYLAYDIKDTIKLHSTFTLSEGVTFAIYPNEIEF